MERETIQHRMTTVDGQTSGFDYLRICLAVAVLAWHALPLTAGADQAAHFMESWYGCLVRIVLPLFFSLSGFLVASSLERNPLWIFLSFRSLRIIPALAVEIFLSALILGPLLTTFSTINYFSDNLFFRYFLNVFGFIHYELPGLFANNPFPSIVNGSLWTVPYELESYLALAVLAFLGIATRPRIVFALVAGGTIFLLAFSYLKETPGFRADSPVPGRVLVLCFLAGTMLYAGKGIIRYSKTTFIFCLLIALLFLSFPILYIFTPIPVSYVTVWIGLRNFKRLPLLFSGDYSYGIYLYAFPIQQTWALFLAGRAGYWTILILSLATVVGFAAFSWHVVERPTLSLKRLFRNGSAVRYDAAPTG
jgi:peptidoglycan/LPS O-acetylase OafA/YrhL